MQISRVTKQSPMQKVQSAREAPHEVLLHLSDSFIRNRQTQLLLSFGQVEPELSPSAKASLFM